MPNRKIKTSEAGGEVSQVLDSGLKWDGSPRKKPGESFEEFLRLKINADTRRRYIRAVRRLLAWCSLHEVRVEQATVLHLAAYVEGVKAELAAPTVRVHLAAIRNLFEWFVSNGVITENPAQAILGPSDPSRLPGISDVEKARLIRCIELDTVIDFRDRALIATLVYASTDIPTVASLRVADYMKSGEECWLQLGEGSSARRFAVDAALKEYLEYYITLAGIRTELNSALFRKVDRDELVCAEGLNTDDFLRILKRRAKLANVPSRSCCHCFLGDSNSKQNRAEPVPAPGPAASSPFPRGNGRNSIARTQDPQTLHRR